MKNQEQNLQILSNFVIFSISTGKVNIDVYFQDNTLWLSQKRIAELFQKGRTTITEHLKNIFSDGELIENSVCRDFRHTAEDGKVYNSSFYNLNAITAVGYRVNSERAIEFRKWANQNLKEYIIKGFVMDDERLKNPDGRPDYFDELLARIRDVLASEKRFYQRRLKRTAGNS
jgi:hypothetical protein